MCGLAGVMTRDGAPPDPALLDRLEAALGASRPRRAAGGCCAAASRWCTRGSPSSTSTPATSRCSRPAAPRWWRTARSTTTRELRAAMAAHAVPHPLGLRAGGVSLRARRRRLRRRRCAACMPSRCTIRAATGWCWRAIRSASNRYTTHRPPREFAFASEPQALVAAGLARPRSTRVRRAELLQLKFTTGARHDLPRHQAGAAGRDAGGRGRRASSSAAAAPRCRTGRRCDPAMPTALAELERVLLDSVSVHLRADVPIRPVPLGRHRFLGAAGADDAGGRHPHPGADLRLGGRRRGGREPRGRAAGRAHGR